MAVASRREMANGARSSNSRQRRNSGQSGIHVSLEISSSENAARHFLSSR
jgi:hypothetical protein